MGPPHEYHELREEGIVAVHMPMGATAWFVTRYADVRELLADPRLIRPTINEWPPPTGQPPDTLLTTMMELNGPRHTALRKAVAEEFSARVVRLRTGRIRELADQLLDDFETGRRPGDLVAGFAEPFPLLVVCDMVGIPYDERGYFLPPADAALGALQTLEVGRKVTKILREYVIELVTRKRDQPANDVLTNLVRRCDAAELTQEDLISFGLSMLIAGYRTSTMFLANAVLTLLTHSGQLAGLRHDRSLIPCAVEELLRYLPVMNGSVVLVAIKDIQLHGQTIRAGEAVLPVIAAGNRDDSVFPGADRLDLCRAQNPHLSFGRGAHNCVGSYLARVELTVALEALLDRFPRLHLAVAEHEVPWDDGSPSKSPDALLVNW